MSEPRTHARVRRPTRRRAEHSPTPADSASAREQQPAHTPAFASALPGWLSSPAPEARAAPVKTDALLSTQVPGPAVDLEMSEPKSVREPTHENAVELPPVPPPVAGTDAHARAPPPAAAAAAREVATRGDAATRAHAADSRQGGARDAKRAGAAGGREMLVARAPGGKGKQLRATGDTESEFEALEVLEVEELPPEAAEPVDTSVEAPPLDTSSLSPSWPLADSLPDDALPPMNELARAATRPAKPPAESKKKGGEGQEGDDKSPPAAEAPAAPSEPEDASHRRAEAEAVRELARRSYADLAPAARREQEGFVGLANQIVRDIVDDYGRTTDEMISGHRGQISDLQVAAERATTTIDAAAGFAQLELEESGRAATLAIDAAGRSAYGLINAADSSAGERIAKEVEKLVAGHLGAYNDSITSLTTSFESATTALNNFRDQRLTNYPISGPANMDNARHEPLFKRIPGWVEREYKSLDDKVKKKKKGWETARDSTSCSLGCGFKTDLTKRCKEQSTQGKSSVARALSQARKTVREQSSQGRRTLREQRRSFLDQVQTQQRAAESRLTAQARAALGGARQEAQGAMSGVQSAVRESLPNFWRGVEGYGTTLRRSAAGGPAALKQTATNGGPGVLQGTQRTRAQLDDRLRGNLARLRSGLRQRARTQQDDSATAEGEAEGTLQGLERNADETFQATNDGLTQAFSGLGDTVSQAASSWAQPLAKRMAADIAKQKEQADKNLGTLLNGGPPPAPGGGGGDSHDCNCPSGGGGGGATGPAKASPGLIAETKQETTEIDRRAKPADFFDRQIKDAYKGVEDNLKQRVTDVRGGFASGWGGTVDEAKVVGALRGLSVLRGRALRSPYYSERSNGGSIEADILKYLGPDDNNDYKAAMAYLSGNAAEGASFELQESKHWYNDDEKRIEDTMRALSPDQIAQLGREHADVVKDTQDALGGTDLEVFNALAKGNYALADAYRMRDAVDEARYDGNAKAANAAIARYTGAPAENSWGADSDVSAEERRKAVVQALGGIVPDAAIASAAGKEGVGAMTAEQRAIAYVTRDIVVYTGGGGDMGGPADYETRSITGANKDLSIALLQHGENSIEARAARIGVELQNKGDDPSALEIDKATFDSRFVADPSATDVTPEQREEHRRAAEDRARVVMLAAQKYAGADAPPQGFTPGGDNPQNDPNAAMKDNTVVQARDRLITQLRGRFGDDTVGADLAAGLLTDARPTAATNALAMRHAMYSHLGTDEELIFRFTERLTRKEVGEMRDAFQKQTGKSLDAELGVYGEGGTFTELSGDDRLRMERAMMGVPQTDQERLEVAAFALAQQRNETGGFGQWLADGTIADQDMRTSQQQLEALAGGPIAISRRGELLQSLPTFDPKGHYTGADHEAFLRITDAAQGVAQNYSDRISAFADIATTGIAILGAIAAAVITVVTGGAAAPLIAAALITGLASMSANYAIKGGRYGWEQAGIDLAMTAVQAVTAGVGAQLGAAAQVASKGAAAASQASRTLLALSKIFTESPVVNAIIIGAITGSISGLGTTALDEHTWESKDPVGALLGGLLKGALAGAATSALTSSIENIGSAGKTIGERMQKLTAEGGAGNALKNMLLRGGARALLAGGGGMAGRSTEILFDAATGKFHGDSGDALMEIGKAGLHSAIQGFGEGSAESVGGRFHNATLRKLESDIAQERAGMKLPPLPPEQLTAAAHDLMFLNQVGEGGKLGQAIHLDHVAANGGLEPHTLPPDVPPAARKLPATEEGGDRAARTAAHEETEQRAAATPRDEAEPAGAAPRTGEPEPEPSGPTRPPGGGDDEGGGPPRGPRGGGGDDEEGRQFPRLTDEEVDRAIGEAKAGPGMRVGAEQPGADARPLPPLAEGEVSLPQRQRAGALQEEAAGLSARAGSLHEEANAMEAKAQIAEASGNAERAERLRGRAAGLREQAGELETQANSRRAEAAEFLGGRRSATADLPGAEDLDAMFAHLTSEQPGLLHIGLSQIEAHPELLPRMVRPLLEGETGGRMVFRVESERSRSLVQLDAHGNVQIEGGASVHLNFGSFERAMEFVLNNSAGRARIFSFEVDEAWVRAARSAAIPEAGTAPLAGRQPRVVDVRFGHDQMEIPPALIGELNRMIVPGSGRVHEVDVPGRPGGGGGPTEEGPLPRPPSDEGGAGPRAAPRNESEEAARRALSGEPPENFGTADQAAAGIRGSRFTGDTELFGLGGATQSGIENAANHLADAGGALEGRLRPVPGKENSDRFVIPGRTPDEPDIPVRLDLVRELPRVKGEMQAARYDLDPDVPGGIVIKVARNTPATEVQRALAHEVRELRALPVKNGVVDLEAGRKIPDALGSGGKGGRLSPHDQGRLGEIDVMARQLAALDPTHPDTPMARRRLMDETERLVDHLGLLGDTDAAKARRSAIQKALAEDTPAGKLLQEAITSAADNPFLKPLPRTLDGDLELLARQLERARAMDASGPLLKRREQEIIDQAALALMREKLVEQRVTKKGFEPASEFFELQKMRARMTPEQQELLDLATAAAKKKPPFVLNDRRPSPGFEARFLSEDVPHAELGLPDDLGLKVKMGKGKKAVDMRVDEAVDRRQQLRERSAQLELDYANATDDASRKRINTELKEAQARIRDLSEALGVAAGRRFIESHPELSQGKIVAIPRDGSAVPDLAVKMPDGSIAIVECKGGGAELGTRKTLDDRHLVEQGRREYIESLAAAMIGQPEPTHSAGLQLQGQIDRGEDVKCFLVRQPFDTVSGAMEPPEVSEFDTSRR